MKKILGTMTFGDQVDRDNAGLILERFIEAGNSELDTAYQYCGGATEKMLGELLPPPKRETIYLASKVNPWNDFGLQPDQVEKQLNECLTRLGSDYLDLLYLHSPDLETPIEKTLERCFELYQQGKFREFGLSNFAAWQVAEVVELCRSNGWMVPTVYQGMYNALTRDVETELFPCLRNYAMRFYAYNPLAGGLLSGKYSSIDAIPDSGRFTVERGYQSRYWKNDYFEVLQKLSKVSQETGISAVKIAIGWLLHHSKLEAQHGDAIILGVSKMEHLSENITAFEQQPLEQSILDILDQGWQTIKPDCFRYFRP
ncbi:MAG: aflatoxin B1 aldehyde reductase [Planctomycetota bacterium]|jgi:aflatoxin B1 aldehyde reductase